MDKTDEPYNVMKAALYENRLVAYKYAPWIDELKSLKRIVTKSNRVKIDHPNDPKEGTCSKDVADAVTGVVHGLTQYPPGRIMTGGEMMAAMLSKATGGQDVDIPDEIEQDGDDSFPMPFLTSDPMDPEDER
jgi:hypothetical protein